MKFAGHQNTQRQKTQVFAPFIRHILSQSLYTDRVLQTESLHLVDQSLLITARDSILTLQSDFECSQKQALSNLYEMQSILLDKNLDRKRLNSLLESVATQLNNLGQLGDKWLELCRQPLQQSHTCQCKDLLRTATCLSDMTTTF